MIGFIDEENRQIIVMEYFENGNLKDFNTKYMMGCDCWARKVKMILEISLGMNFLHTMDPPVIHRDLKLNNIFVDDRWKVKVRKSGEGNQRKIMEAPKRVPIKGIVSDSNNNILGQQLEDNNKNRLFPKFQFIPILLFTSYT